MKKTRQINRKKSRKLDCSQFGISECSPQFQTATIGYSAVCSFVTPEYIFRSSYFKMLICCTSPFFPRSEFLLSRSVCILRVRICGFQRMHNLFTFQNHSSFADLVFLFGIRKCFIVDLVMHYLRVNGCLLYIKSAVKHNEVVA